MMIKREAEIIEKGLPSNLEAEQSVLGGILLDNAAYNPAAELLQPQYFSNTRNQRIFALMVELAEASKPIDAVTLTEQASQQGGMPTLEAIGGASYLGSLTEGLPRASNVHHYAHIVKDKAAQRRLARAGDAILKDALDNTPPADIIEQADSYLQQVSESLHSDGPRLLAEIFEKSYDSLDELVDAGPKNIGTETGFRELDRITYGLQQANLIMVAARPSIGKTAWALGVAAYAALHCDITVLICSLEMSEEEVLLRLLCAEAGVDSHRLRSGFLDRVERQQISQAMGRLCKAKIFIDDTPGLRLPEMRAKARRIKREHGLGLMVLDYIQLMHAPKAENRNQEISALSRGLKALAKELNVPLVVLSQLSRAPESENRRPRLSDLRDSGSLEQDADVVMFLHRPDYYRRMRGEEIPVHVEGSADLVVAKHRNGPTSTVPLVFLSRFARFDNRSLEK